jgi:hypothetical protein
MRHSYEKKGLFQTNNYLKQITKILFSLKIFEKTHFIQKQMLEKRYLSRTDILSDN